MARKSKEKNPFEYILFEGQECVRFQTVGKHKYSVIVDRSAWDNYLSQHTWTVSMQGKRPSTKTSIDKQSIFLWRLIIEKEYGELETWGTTIDHINRDPLDNRKTNLRIFNSAILNSTNISSKFEDEGRQYIHKVTSGYKIHYNLAGRTFYWGCFSASEYGSDEQALEAAKAYRDEVVLSHREKTIEEMKRKTRDVEFRRGLRDKIAAGEIDEVVAVLKDYGLI